MAIMDYLYAGFDLNPRRRGNELVFHTFYRSFL